LCAPDPLVVEIKYRRSRAGGKERWGGGISGILYYAAPTWK
jgi:hypothetical protein